MEAAGMEITTEHIVIGIFSFFSIAGGKLILLLLPFLVLKYLTFNLTLYVLHWQSSLNMNSNLFLYLIWALL
jgi:hypothetical protein